MKPILLSLISVLLFTSLAVSQEKDRKEEQAKGYQEISLPMTDGVLLGTAVFIPKTKKKCPAVLVRTPYGIDTEKWLGKAFGLFGIAVVIQDVRGKFKSGGEYYPFVNERADGLQTLRWIREQPWSNGIVAGWGASYVGYTQWAIADSLNFLSPLLTGARLYDFVYPDGLFSLQTAFTWGFLNASKDQNKITPEKLAAGIMVLPISVADDSTIRDIPFVNDWIAHETFDSYWQQMNFRGLAKAPVISAAGWYDIFLKTQIEDFQALEALGHNDNRLIIGPWCHGSQGEENKYGGVKKSGNPSKVFLYTKNFLKGKRNRLTSPFKDTKYNLFIMERNEYVGSDVWPPRETRITPYYIGPGNYLSSVKLRESGILQFTYNPADPYPSHGGTALGNGVGPARQNENTGRKDQVVFEMDVTEKPLILLGPISATLWLGSDAPCTDFMVGLQDVFPDGKIINIQEGGAHVKFDIEKPKETEISVWATGYQLNPGHKLRVFIASGWFPRFNRSLNNCQPGFTANDMVNARQKVYYGNDTPSSINLPNFEMAKK
ncbi:MAG: CocE/NonD family hydrolase [Bacteroidia bacterium]|nr:CocE/NonD family hydrolase [Bacteroidia bacterium]